MKKSWLFSSPPIPRIKEDTIMKKILFALLLAAVLLTGFALAEEEEYFTVDFELDGYSMAGGMLTFTYADGSTEERGSWGFSADIPLGSTKTLGEILAIFDITGVEAVNADDTFEGFMPFEVVVTTDEDGWDTWTYVRAGDALYTAEELLALPAPETYTVYAAKWAGAAEEEYFAMTGEEEYIVIPSVTLYAGEGALIYQSEDGEIYDASLSVSSIEPGQLVRDALSLDTLVDLRCEGKTFAGWTVYEVGSMDTFESETAPIVEDALCFEVFTGWYTVVSDYALLSEGLSTEEMGQLTLGETDWLIIAKWQ